MVFNIHNYINNIQSVLVNYKDSIYNEGDRNYNAIYFVLRGEITLNSNFKDTNRKARSYHTGEFFGEYEFLNRISRTHTAIVTSDFAKIGILNLEYFLRLSKNNPVFLNDILMASINRLSELNDHILKTSQNIDLLFNQYIKKNTENE